MTTETRRAEGCNFCRRAAPVICMNGRPDASAGCSRRSRTADDSVSIGGRDTAKPTGGPLTLRTPCWRACKDQQFGASNFDQGRLPSASVAAVDAFVGLVNVRIVSCWCRSQISTAKLYAVVPIPDPVAPIDNPVQLQWRNRYGGITTRFCALWRAVRWEHANCAGLLGA